MHMKKEYHIENSCESTGRCGFRVRVGKRGRAENVIDTIQYGPICPSGPGAVMAAVRSQLRIGDLNDEKTKYIIGLEGVVDDGAGFEVAGHVFETEMGDDIEFSTHITDISSGYYALSVSHTNADVIPEYNEALLACSVTCSDGEVIEIEPDENEEPDEEEECGCEDDEEESGTCGTTAEGGGGAEARGARAGGRVMGDWESTSGGRNVRRESSAKRMKWSAQFGVFRGIAKMPPGRLEINTSKPYSAELGTPAGLQWRHPLASHLELPEGGVKRNNLLSIKRGGSTLNYMVDGEGAASFAVGASSPTTTQVVGVASMSPKASAACSVKEARYIRASYTDGGSTYYNPSTGACEGYVTEGGYVMSAAEGEQYAAVVRDEAGVIRQVWNTWDGLADIIEEEQGGYSIRIYPPAQVSEVGADGLFVAKGEPVKIFSVRADGETQSVSVRERDMTLTRQVEEMVTTWVWENEAWSMIEGRGSEAIETRRERTNEGEERYSVITRKIKNGKVASSVKEEYQISLTGDLLMRKTEGYGEAGAHITEYTYTELGQQETATSSKNGQHKNVYDMQGRVRISTEPWSEESSGERSIETEYRSDVDGYSDEVAAQRIVYSTNSMLQIWQRTQNEYSETEEVQRIVHKVQKVSKEQDSSEIHVESEHESVEETWRAGAPPYAAGRIKMKREENGVETHYSYAATSEHGALYSVSAETKANGNLVPGQSEKKVSYISQEGNTLREESYVLTGAGEWKLTDGVTYSYDKLNRQIGAKMDNGRSTQRELTCQGKPLWEIDENGIRTDYVYDSARQLIETTRSAVYDGEECITPEIITEYERDAAGRVTKTTTHTGAMKTETRTEYDLQGRIIRQEDELGRITTTTYSADGRIVTTTTPSGATLINTYNTDGSLQHAAGDGQRELRYKYDYINGLRTTTYLKDGTSILSQRIIDSYGQLITLTAPTTLEDTYLYTRSDYNLKGQLTRQRQGELAPTLYEYDSMGNVSKETTLLAENAPEDPTQNCIILSSYSYEQDADGNVYRVITRQRNNPQGEWLTSTQKTLISKLSPTLASKQTDTDERGHTTTNRTEYGAGAMRKNYRQIPTSDITAESIAIDGFITKQTDNVGITSTYTRRYLENGTEQRHTDGRGNTTTTLTDIAERPIRVTDAAGDTTTTLYDPASNNPATITDALGNTTNYAYDARGRKIAEYGTAIQPATFAYDDADRLTRLTTWRADGETISADPRELEGGESTTWEYNPTTGLEISITYPDGKGTHNTYDRNNRLALRRDARGATQTYNYTPLQGVCTEIIATMPAAAAPPENEAPYSIQQFSYNIYNQLTEITDDSGTRRLTYDKYGTLLLEESAIGTTHYTLHEALDTYGRNTGYSLQQNNAQLCAASVGYAADGRIRSAGFIHSGEEKPYTYTYLPGANLLQKLNMPNNMSLEQNYEEKRDLLATMSYTRGGSTLVVRRSYTYDALARPTTRKTERRGGVMNETFTYNNRSELTDAMRDSDHFAYNYDNIGNRITAQEIAEQITYTANELNQYTQINTNGNTFEPEYDAAGNQTLVQTATGIWKVEYNAQNRAVRFESADGNTIITCAYDFMGRRFEKKVTTAGETTLHQRYLYRGYLQIACLDLTRDEQPALWYITWDPTQPTATRPLALQKDGTWYTYGWDLTKNITEVYTTAGQLDTDYVYTPYGTPRPAGTISQPIQWSSEYHDEDLALVYYNYRYYNPQDGRWTRRDPSDKGVIAAAYIYCLNSPISHLDVLGGDLLDDIQGVYATIATLLEGYYALRDANVIGADKWFHCLYMCRATRNGNLPNFTLLLAASREIFDLIKGRFFPGIDSKTKEKLTELQHAIDSLEDMEANKIGINCPENKTCECCCSQYKVNGID